MYLSKAFNRGVPLCRSSVLLIENLKRHNRFLSCFSAVRFQCVNESREEHTENEGNPASEFYDIVIAGAGMVGTGMACALGHNKMFEHQKILLLETGSKPTYSDDQPEAYSNRVCALNPQTVQLMEKIDAWQHIQEIRTKSVCRMQVWDACSDALITFDQGDLTISVAHIVENDVTLRALSKQLEKTKVEVQYNTKAKKIEFPSKVDPSAWVKIQLENGKFIETRLLIAADGNRSKIREAANINHIGWDYDQSGVVATLMLSEPVENTVAWQRFLPSGPIAMLPLTDTLSSLVWSVGHDRAKALVSMPEDQFVDAVNSAFWKEYESHEVVYTVSNVVDSLLRFVKPEGTGIRQLPPSIIGVSDGSRARFPLGLGHASYYVKPRLALIGDAAHRVHPLAGQGVNLGFGDVMSLTSILEEALSIGGDVGSMLHLCKYETERQRHIVPIMATIDGLKRLYSTDRPEVVLLRTVGLKLTNAIQPLKDQLMTGASS
ncbi:ubiquinone biosynthesis monooxygenase COQ6, mitochondrial-like [Anneissia japonica]|uniref:ubiquinone biosynthesis monooxygenase COQ6, mitochondrial-like n=1 Tax=Anneissia japonica TaxID=1529436 RepID=UPI0014258B04|nr:ubiquinone biosynthesis monooxygenase COQ6, mitochondrial-like [Anneissia japonica]